jgi:hypothetical protein
MAEGIVGRGHGIEIRDQTARVVVSGSGLRHGSCSPLPGSNGAVLR